MKKISIMIMVLVVALASCKKTPEVNLKYVDVERDLVTVGTTTANIQCDYDYIATLKKAYLFYGEGMDEADFTSAEMRVVQNTLYVELMGLKSNTTYNYYYEFHNGFNSMRTALKNFKTEAGNGGGEEPPTPEITLPTVITAVVTEITTNSANGGGEVTDDGGDEVTERGICWSTHANPTLEDSHVAAGSGMGAFSAVMNGLEANTTYHVRAYAINVADTAYGLDKEFVTIGGGGTGGVPEGAINGLFTINENGDQVYFSQGNLQYQASTNTWRFAEHQWDIVGNDTLGTVYENGVKCKNSLISPTYDGWIDLFCWGTSGYNHGASCYQPYSTDDHDDRYYAYGSYTYNLYDLTGQADWGYNMILNGGNQTNQWRTLKGGGYGELYPGGDGGDWYYVLNLREASTINGTANARYTKAIVNGTPGIVLFPDQYTHPIEVILPVGINASEEPFTSNCWTDVEWLLMEKNGTVFLPAAGWRQGPLLIMHVGVAGIYWSSSYDNLLSPTWCAFSLGFMDEFIHYANGPRGLGRSVRLVQDANPQNKAR